jgi:hypothetical protein
LSGDDDLDSALGFGVAAECVVHGATTHQNIVGTYSLDRGRQIVLRPVGRATIPQEALGERVEIVAVDFLGHRRKGLRCNDKIER